MRSITAKMQTLESSISQVEILRFVILWCVCIHCHSQELYYDINSSLPFSCLDYIQFDPVKTL